MKKLINAIVEKMLRRKWGDRLYGRKVKDALHLLFPSAYKEKERTFYYELLKLSLEILAVGIIITLIFLGQYFINRRREESNIIYRPNYGGEPEPLVLQAEAENESKMVFPEIKVEVQPRIYSQEEIKKLYEQALPFLEKEMLGKNGSLDRVTDRLYFPTSLEGFPFKISWETEDYELVHSDGKIETEKIPDEGKTCLIKAFFEYEDFVAEYQQYIRIQKEKLSEKEILTDRILKEIEEKNVNDREEEKFILPAEVDGWRLSWDNDSQKIYWGLLLFFPGLVFFAFFAKEKDLEKQLEERERQMRMQYPDIVRKISIYMGAGMSIRNAWEKIVKDSNGKALKQRNYAYEEMEITCNEMKTGILEAEAYERFGRRCRQQLYMKFSSLVVQNLKKGSNGLLGVLKEESRLAFEERKNLARKMGEEAGTKLLLPMMLMLCLVMLMIMIPAFMTF